MNVIHGTHDAVNFICDHPDIRAISFVGSDLAVFLVIFMLCCFEHIFIRVNIFMNAVRRTANACSLIWAQRTTV